MAPDAHRLRVFADKSKYDPAHRKSITSILKPLWKDEPYEKKLVTYGPWIDLFEEAPSREEADLVVATYDWNYYVNRGQVAGAAQEHRAAQAAGKPILFVSGGDFTANLPFRDAWLYQASAYQSKRLPNEHAQPAFHEDKLTKYMEGKVQVRDKQAKPVVGFCGLAGGNPLRFLGRRARLLMRLASYKAGRARWEPPPVEATGLRKRILDILAGSPAVTANFIIRDQYLAGASTQPDQSAVRTEFLNNVVGSDYTLCVRGTGNYSQRFYEALCLGRIPVFVNTDCILPFDDRLDWKRYCVWVEEHEIPRIGDKIAEFHARLDDAAFRDLQRECRTVWEQYLTTNGFYVNLHDQVSSRLGRGHESMKARGGR